jgi:hypothetical protein
MDIGRSIKKPALLKDFMIRLIQKQAESKANNEHASESIIEG